MDRLPSDDLEKQKFLEKVAISFKESQHYSEEEVNNMIKLVTKDDYVLVRRELVNFGYLGRDPYKGDYWLIKNKLTDEELQRIAKNNTKIKDM
ncbi:MAG: DUF2087 domain-containing protein [Candidatus Woesearchaeota archaeon]